MAKMVKKRTTKDKTEQGFPDFQKHSLPSDIASDHQLDQTGLHQNSEFTQQLNASLKLGDQLGRQFQKFQNNIIKKDAKKQLKGESHSQEQFKEKDEKHTTKPIQNGNLSKEDQNSKQLKILLVKYFQKYIVDLGNPKKVNPRLKSIANKLNLKINLIKEVYKNYIKEQKKKELNEGEQTPSQSKEFTKSLPSRQQQQRSPQSKSPQTQSAISKSPAKLSERRNELGIYKKTANIDNAMRKILEGTPFACISDLCQKILEKEGLKLTRETVIRRLKQLNYRYQKFTMRKPIKNNNMIKQQRVQYVGVLEKVRNQNYKIMYYSYCHITLDEFKSSMWIKVNTEGEPDYQVPQQNVLTICLLIYDSTVQFYRIYSGNYSRHKFMQFFTEYTKRNPKKDLKSFQTIKRRNTFLVLEACREHMKYSEQKLKIVTCREPKQHNEYDEQINMFFNMENIEEDKTSEVEYTNDQTKHFLAHMGFITMYLPVYSSKMNPVDLLFNFIKFPLRGDKPRQLHDIQVMVQKAINQKLQASQFMSVFKSLDKIYQKVQRLENLCHD